MKPQDIIALRPDKVIYRDGGLAVKLFNHGYSKADILNEALNQARVEQTALRVPRLESVGRIGERWAIASEFIPGKTLAAIIEESSGKGRVYLSLFVSLQLTIHAQPCALMIKLRDKLNRKIGESGLEPAVRYKLHTLLEGMPTHNKLCHGDFNPENIILSESGAPYILDWAHATQGNASADTALTYLLFRLAGHPELAEPYLDLFCENSGTPRGYVHKWIPIVAAARIGKCKPQERDFLLHCVNTADF